jgi:hypothetical protein
MKCRATTGIDLPELGMSGWPILCKVAARGTKPDCKGQIGTSPLRPTEISSPDGLTDDLKPGVDVLVGRVSSLLQRLLERFGGGVGGSDESRALHRRRNADRSVSISSRSWIVTGSSGV